MKYKSSRKRFAVISVLLAVISALTLMSGLCVGRAYAVEQEAFETNLSDWIAVDGSRWDVTENGFTSDMISGIEDEPLKYLAKSGQKVDGTRSFKYEVEFVIDGYGAGLSLYTGSRTNFYAVEVNKEGHVYFPTMSSGGWSTFAPYGTQLSAEEIDAFNGKHNMVFEYDAVSRSAKVTVDGVVRSEGVTVPGKAMGGYLGVYFEGCNSCCFTKAVYTELEGGQDPVDLKDNVESNLEFECVYGEAEYTAKGLGGTAGGANPKCLIRSNQVIDGTKSFKYEVAYSCEGYGAGMGFGVIDEQNYRAVEINKEKHIYFPLMAEGNWSTFYANAPDLTDEEASVKEHTITFIYDATDWFAEVYVDGVIRQEIYDLDPDVIAGNLGLFFEGATAFFTKAVYTELEMATKAPEQATEVSDPTAAPTKALAATPTQEPTEAPVKVTEEPGQGSDTGKIILIIGIAAVDQKEKEKLTAAVS